MPETEPITVLIRADATEMRTGFDQARGAMKAFGDESAHTSLKIRDTADSSRALFTGLVNMRVASMATQRVMKELGINNEFVTRSFDAMNLVMDVAIALSAIYRAAKVAEKIASWLAAKAKFAEMAANMGMWTFGAGALVAAGIAAAVIASISAIPHGQFGGIIPPRIGGTPVLAGEAGRPEALIPLDRMGDFGGMGGGIQINIERIETNDARELVRTLGREIELAKLAGA